MSESAELMKQLMELCDLTKRLGGLHEAQILQLKMWGFVISPTKGSFEVVVSTEDATVEYVFARNAELPKDPLVFAKIDESVKWLLGEHWLVRFKKGAGKALYVGKRIQPLEQEVPEEQETTPWRDKLNSQLEIITLSPKEKQKPTSTSKTTKADLAKKSR